MFTQPRKQRNTSTCENYKFHEYLLRHPIPKETEKICGKNRKIVSHYWPSSIIRAVAVIKGDQNKE